MLKVGDEVIVENGDDFTFTRTGSIGIIRRLITGEYEDPETGDWNETAFALVKFSFLNCKNTLLPETSWEWELPIWNLKLKSKQRIFQIGDRVEERKTGDIGVIISMGRDMFNLNNVCYIKWDKNGQIFYLELDDIKFVSQEGVTNEHSG